MDGAQRSSVSRPGDAREGVGPGGGGARARIAFRLPSLGRSGADGGLAAALRALETRACARNRPATPRRGVRGHQPLSGESARL